MAKETRATLVEPDAGRRAHMARRFETVDRQEGSLEVEVYNPSARVRGPIAELDPEAGEGTRQGAFGPLAPG
ncbi:MAG: hypothetical protein ACOC3D_13600 [Pseudomonadota bacterium]